MEVQYISHMGSDLTVVNAARVSHDKHHDEFKSNDEGLISFLAEHNHFTPFAHPHVTLRIKAPIFVARQAFKHKIGFTENEVSRRYVDKEPEFFKPSGWRKRAKDVKQGSSEELVHKVNMTNTVEIGIGAAYTKYLETSLRLYKSLLDAGVCPEQARMVLPQSMYTEWYWTGSLVAYARFYNLRSKPDAQKEIQELAGMVGRAIEGLFPISWRALIR